MIDTKKRYNAKNSGNELEELIEGWLIAESITYIRESTVSATRKRIKGNIDFKITNPVAFIECKQYTNTLSFNFRDEMRDLKWSQVQFLNKKYLNGYDAYLALRETHDKRVVIVHIKDFMTWWCNCSRKSLNVAIALKIGRVVEECKFLKEGVK